MKSKIKCIKCKSVDLYIKELWRDSYITFDQENGVINEVGNKEYGRPYKVQAQCMDCKKSWTLRGVVQITDIK